MQLPSERGILLFSVIDVEDEEKGYGCAGRLILNDKETDLQHIAYVMEEGEGAVNVQLENGRMDSFSKPKLCNKTGRWILRDNGRYSIVEYDPVRIKVLEEGNVWCYLLVVQWEGELVLLVLLPHRQFRSLSHFLPHAHG